MRGLAGVLAVSIVLGAVACAKDPTRPRPIPVRRVADVDEAAVWSHHGQHIAFHRRFFSADGPPGVYFVSKWGGTPRFLAPGNFFWPKMLSFSPDDRYLVGISNFVLIIIDVENASVREALPPGIAAYRPNWSPRGDAIIYERWPGDATPDDSAGFHFLDPRSGNHRPFLDPSGRILRGGNPLWTRDGEEIAFMIASIEDRIYMVRADGTGLRVLATSPAYAPYGYLQWYTRPILGIEALMFSQISGPGGGDYIVNRDGSGLELNRRRIDLGAAGVPSPDGSETVFHSVDPVDSLPALFIRSVDDRTGASVRQLTHYSPPREKR